MRGARAPVFSRSSQNALRTRARRAPRAWSVSPGRCWCVHSIDASSIDASALMHSTTLFTRIDIMFSLAAAYVLLPREVARGQESVRVPTLFGKMQKAISRRLRHQNIQNPMYLRTIISGALLEKSWLRPRWSVTTDVTLSWGHGQRPSATSALVRARAPPYPTRPGSRV